jgi:hypothetical protein
MKKLIPISIKKRTKNKIFIPRIYVHKALSINTKYVNHFLLEVSVEFIWLETWIMEFFMQQNLWINKQRLIKIGLSQSFQNSPFIQL